MKRRTFIWNAWGRRREEGPLYELKNIITTRVKKSWRGLNPLSVRFASFTLFIFPAPLKEKYLRRGRMKLDSFQLHSLNNVERNQEALFGSISQLPRMSGWKNFNKFHNDEVIIFSGKGRWKIGRAIFRVDIAEFRRLERAIESTWVVECPLKISWPGFSFENACERVRRYRRKSKKMRAGRHPPFTVPGFPWLRSERKWSKLWIFPEREVISMRDETFFFSKRDFLVFNESSSILRWIFDYLCGIFLISFCQKQLQQLHRRSFIGRVK